MLLSDNKEVLLLLLSDIQSTGFWVPVNFSRRRSEAISDVTRGSHNYRLNLYTKHCKSLIRCFNIKQHYFFDNNFKESCNNSKL